LHIPNYTYPEMYNVKSQVSGQVANEYKQVAIKSQNSDTSPSL